MGYWHFTILLGALSHYGFVGWIYPILFLISSTWIVLYFKELRDKHKLAREVADKESLSPTNQDDIQKHLVDRIFDEAYTINFISGKIIFTSTWEKQSELEKSKYKRPIKILGEDIDPDNMPKLYRWAIHNPETLERQLDSIAKTWHEGDVMAAMIAFESDLEHS